MATLLTIDSVKRKSDFGFKVLPFTQYENIDEKDLLVVEPTFVVFDNADNDRLAFPFKLLQSIPAEERPKTVVLAVSYSQRNASVFKGWVLDIVSFYKGEGYANFTSVHVPFEAHGCPMVGSTLFLIFSTARFSFVPEKTLTLPSDLFPTLLHHAPAARVKGSVYAGTADLNGFLSSRCHFLPSISLWDSSSLRCEYRVGDTLEARAFPKEDILTLFGLTEYTQQADLHMVVPPTVLRLLLTDIKYL